MTASWAQAITEIATAAAAVAVWLHRQGRRDGKLDQVLTDLAKIIADHEQRIRTLERAGK